MVQVHGGELLGTAHGGLLMPDGLSVAGLMPFVAVCTAIFWATCLLLHPGATCYSMNLYSKVFVYMFCSKDTKWKSVEDPAGAGDGPGCEDRTVIFIRHGESTWNETFNPVNPPLSDCRGRPTPLPPCKARESHPHGAHSSLRWHRSA